MGTCQMANCKCNCTQSRISCQCGSANTLMLEEQNREIIQRRLNRFQSKREQPNSNQKSKSRSNDSSDTVNKTKISTRARSNGRSPQSQEKYLSSLECNLETESEPKKKPIKVMVFPRTRSNKYFSQREVSLVDLPSIRDLKKATSQDNTTDPTKQLSSNIIKQETIKVETIMENSSPLKSAQGEIGSQQQQQVDMHSQPVLKEEPALINRSKTAVEDDSHSVTPRGVLKNKQEQNDSFRTQQQRKVRFDLPHSHYLKERANRAQYQQRFY